MTEPTELGVIDFLTHSKVLIAADATAIWPRIVDVNGWPSVQQLVHTGGEPGALGEQFVAVASAAPDTPLFKVENVELVPLQRRTIRLESLEGVFIGFATWELTSRDYGTIVAYDVYCRSPMLPPGQSPADLMAMAQRLMNEGLEKLKAVVEG